METRPPKHKEKTMTKYFRLSYTVAVPDDALTHGYDEEGILATFQMSLEDGIDNAGCHLVDTAITEMSMVETSWLDTVLEVGADDDDDDDDVFSFDYRPHSSVPSILRASPPQGVPRLDMTGIDPESPEGQDIIQQYADATTPDPDADDAT